MNSNFYSAEEFQEKSVIDDFAKYVAHNGAEYELMTKHKEQGNPMFSFLFGGRYNEYYQQKLEEERNIIDSGRFSYQRSSEYADNAGARHYGPSTTHYDHGYDFNQGEYFPADDVLTSMKGKLEQEKLSLQMMQEEHYRLLSESQRHMNEECISINKEKIVRSMKIVDLYRLSQSNKLCQECSIDFESMEKSMQAILESCTKENICNGKNWVIDNCTRTNNHYPLCMYLLATVSTSTVFNERLHIIYFINDLFHHCKRKNSSYLLEALESVIVPIYSLSVLFADEDGKVKLNKVLSLWESNSYTRKELLDSMRQNHTNPILYLNNWFDNEINMMKRDEDEGLFAGVAVPNDETINLHLSDAHMKLSNLEANNNQLKYELKIKEEGSQLTIYQLERDIKCYEMESHSMRQESLRQHSHSHHQQQHQQRDYNPGTAPPRSEYPAFQMPDTSRPPPGFPLMPMCIDPHQTLPLDTDQSAAAAEMDGSMDLQPVQPYWRLPAAIMVHHIRLSQLDYAPIDSSRLRMPQLRPPSKRLAEISNTFYEAPSHDRPRDTEGWERLALHDFLRAKERVKNGEAIDDLVSSTHVANDNDYDDDRGLGAAMGYDENYDGGGGGEESDFKRKYPPPGSFSTRQHYGGGGGGRRSLLGAPWAEQQMSYGGRSGGGGGGGGGRTEGLLGSVPNTSHSQQKVVPLMSLGLSARRRAEGSYSRSRRQSRYSRSSSRSSRGSSADAYSRSRSRSRSRSYSRSASRSRSPRSSRSRSSRSSGEDRDRRPYKGGFIASRHSSARRSRSRSRTRSRSPCKPSSGVGYQQANSLMHNLPDRRVWSSGMRSELIQSDTNANNTNNANTAIRADSDPFSRFRQQKSSGYTDWMKERGVRRTFEEHEPPMDDY